MPEMQDMVADSLAMNIRLRVEVIVNLAIDPIQNVDPFQNKG
jgi:hypothetical protein